MFCLAVFIATCIVLTESDTFNIGPKKAGFNLKKKTAFFIELLFFCVVDMDN